MLDILDSFKSERQVIRCSKFSLILLFVDYCINIIEIFRWLLTDGVMPLKSIHVSIKCPAAT